MKIKDVMQASCLSVSGKTPIKEVAHLIFSTSLSSLPVVKGSKLIGIISEIDIISYLYPKLQELPSSKNVPKLEKDLSILTNAPVSKIMIKKVTTVTPETSVIEAQGIMVSSRFRMLPVVESRGNRLLGVVSHADIFRNLINEELPKMEIEHYAEFISKNYDKMVDWDKRFEYEFPALFRIFNRYNVKNVLDLGVWTGEYSIGLVKEGVSVIGLDHNPDMIMLANKKKQKLPENLRSQVEFVLTDFSDIQNVVKKEVDAVISMGSSFPYLPNNLESVLLGAKKVLRREKGVVFFQILNMERVLMKHRGLLNFSIQKPRKGSSKRLFLEFYERKDDNTINHNVAIFNHDGKNWIYTGINTVSIKNIKKDEIEKMLKKVGFQNISFSGNQGEYQGEYGQISLIKPFDQKTSEWMNVFATT